MAKKSMRDKSGLSTKERKAVKNLVMNMSEPKQHLSKHSGNVYGVASGGNFYCLSDIPLNTTQGSGFPDETKAERLGQQVLPKSIQVDLHLKGSTESALFHGRTVDYVRVVLFRHRSTLERVNVNEAPNQYYMWGENLPGTGPSIMIEPLNVFNNKDIEVIEDRKISLTGDMDQYTSSTGTYIEKTNGAGKKIKLLRLNVPFKKIVKKLKFNDENVSSLNHSSHVRDTYWIYMVCDETSYGAIQQYNLPEFQFVSRLNFRDIGS